MEVSISVEQLGVHCEDVEQAVIWCPTQIHRNEVDIDIRLDI